jgi:glyoxylase-like metal-dependent hydrolase (beta-lactamase superfamily II)
MNSDTLHFQLGDFSCIAIKDAAACYPIAMFLTNLAKDRYEPELLQRGEDPLQFEIPYTCLLIDTGRERVLVDTGMGADYSGPGGGKVLSLLRREGIDPREIGTVVLSHGHPDHIGGSLDEAGKSAFANARYVMFRKEWDFWSSTPTLAELPVDDSFRKVILASAQKNLTGVQEQLDLLEPETEIVPGIVAIAAFGHSPGQMGLEISSSGQRLLFMADAFVVPLHLDYPDSIGATDHCPGEMVATRIRLLEKAVRDRSLVSISHFAFPGLGYVAAKGNRWEWEALAGATEVGRGVSLTNDTNRSSM